MLEAAKAMPSVEELRDAMLKKLAAAATVAPAALPAEAAALLYSIRRQFAHNEHTLRVVDCGVGAGGIPDVGSVEAADVFGGRYFLVTLRALTDPEVAHAGLRPCRAAAAAAQAGSSSSSGAQPLPVARRCRCCSIYVRRLLKCEQRRVDPDDVEEEGRRFEDLSAGLAVPPGTVDPWRTAAGSSAPDPAAAVAASALAAAQSAVTQAAVAAAAAAATEKAAADERAAAAAVRRANAEEESARKAAETLQLVEEQQRCEEYYKDLRKGKKRKVPPANRESVAKRPEKGPAEAGRAAASAAEALLAPHVAACAHTYSLDRPVFAKSGSARVGAGGLSTAEAEDVDALGLKAFGEAVWRAKNTKWGLWKPNGHPLKSVGCLLRLRLANSASGAASASTSAAAGGGASSLCAMCTLQWAWNKGYRVIENLAVAVQGQGDAPQILRAVVAWLGHCGLPQAGAVPSSSFLLSTSVRGLSTSVCRPSSMLVSRSYPYSCCG